MSNEKNIICVLRTISWYHWSYTAINSYDRDRVLAPYIDAFPDIYYATEEENYDGECLKEGWEGGLLDNVPEEDMEEEEDDRIFNHDEFMDVKNEGMDSEQDEVYETEEGSEFEKVEQNGVDSAEDDGDEVEKQYDYPDENEVS